MNTSHHLSYDPDYAEPPGTLIQEYLDQLDISGRELARRCGRSAKLIAEIVAGKAPLEPETALQLERVLELSASISLRMEAAYRLHLARAQDDETLAAYAPWAQTFPLKELQKRGHLQLADKPAELVRHLLAFFGCGSIDACKARFSELLSVEYRHSPSFESDQLALLAWLRVGEIKAERVNPAEYDRAKFLDALKEIRGITTQPIEVFLPTIERLCADAGVAFILEKPFQGVSLSGISRWLSPRRALIQQTLRHKANDHFWFTFFHECAHLLLHSRKVVFLDGDGAGNIPQELEHEANDWAANFLIPADAMTKFVTRFGYTEQEVISFAAAHNIAPGIVVGQLQHRKVLGYDQMHYLKQRYKWTS